MTINFKKINWVLASIIIFAAILRFWHLGTIPPSLTPDEAALGYNAYSILHTGKDEYGKFLPVIFKSFGDYKPGLYIYLTIPGVAVLGLSEFSTRLPSALAGILSVYLTYLIVKLLFPDKRRLPTFAAFIAATNPWLIYFSRGAWEANVSLMLTLAGIYFFLKSLHNSKFIVHSSILFALTLLTYQGAKLSTVLVLAILFVIYRKEIFTFKRRELVRSIFLGILICLPVILSLFNGQSSRLTVFSIFSYHRPPSEIQKYSDSYYYLFHSEPLNYLRAIVGRWFNIFSGKFLFFQGDGENPLQTAPYQGALLFSDILFLPLGFYALFKNKLQKEHFIILLWLLLAPFSTAISRDTTNAVRSLNTAVPLTIIISFGLSFFLERLRNSGLVLAFTLYLLTFTYFADAYFIHVPAHNSNLWRYGYKEAVNYVETVKTKYNNILFEQSFNQPYIYFLFFGPKDPRRYQDVESLVDSQYKGDVGFVEHFDNVGFRSLDWQVLKRQSGTLIIASPVSIPPEIFNNPKIYPIVKEIKYLNGRDVAFDIIEIK